MSVYTIIALYWAPTIREQASSLLASGTDADQAAIEACPVCGETVKRDQMELEIELRHDGATPGLDRYRLHPRCFAAWEFERTNDGDSRQGWLSI